MKVLHINDVSNTARHFVSGLRENGISSDLYQPALGVGRSKLYKCLLPLKRTLEARNLNRYLKQNGYRFAHIHYGTFSWLGLVGNFPYFLHLHGNDVWVDAERWFYKVWLHRGIEKAESVFCSTPDLITRAQVLWPNISLRFIPNPVDVDAFPLAPPRHGSPPLRILSISKLDEKKGLDILLQAMRMIRRQWSPREVSITSLGFGTASPMRRRYLTEQMSKLQVEVLYNRLPYNQIPKLISAHDLILGQFGNAGAIGMSELEAMSCGRPVIGRFHYSDIYPEPCPILCADTAEECVEHIHRLLSDIRAMHQLGERCREWVTRYHDYRSVARILAEVYFDNA